MNQINLNNKFAVVRIGAQGIGLAIAERLVTSGSSSCIWDRDENFVNNTLNETGSCGIFYNAI